MRKNLFGSELLSGWKTSLHEFEKSYLKIPNITIPLKVHVLLSHTEEFINKFAMNKGLGFFSEQTGESIHQKFLPIYNKYKMKNTEADNYGEHLKQAVVDFSSSHV